MGTCGIIITSLFGIGCITNIIGAIWDYKFYRDKNHRGYRDICIASACVYGFFAIAFGILYI